MRWGMVVDLSKCVRCYACLAACRIEHFLPMGITWPKLVALETGGAHPEVSTYSVRCDHWTMAVPDHAVYQKVYDADVIINTCTLKRHFIASMTCALKNNVGTVTGQNATGTRGYLHGLGSGTPGFHREVAEIAGLINPELNVVDARAVLTVSGPVTSAGVVENVGKLVVCGDMVATDLYCAQLLANHDSSFDPASLNVLISHAVDLGLGVATLDDVKIIETTES